MVPSCNQTEDYSETEFWSNEALESDDFRMFEFKVVPCPRKCFHNWTSCPFAHPGEKSKRRDPRTCDYLAIPCPHMKQNHECEDGDDCPYSHNVFEFWLHPTRYRTQMCQKGLHCKREVCFFAHTEEQLRVHKATPSPPSILTDIQIDSGSTASSCGADGSTPGTPMTLSSAVGPLVGHLATPGEAPYPKGVQQDIRVTVDLLDATAGAVPVQPAHINPLPLALSTSELCMLPQTSCPTVSGPRWTSCVNQMAPGGLGGLTASSPWDVGSLSPTLNLGACPVSMEVAGLSFQTGPGPTLTSLLPYVAQPVHISQPLQVPSYQEYIQMCLQLQMAQATPQFLAPSSVDMMAGGLGGSVGVNLMTVDHLSSLLQQGVVC